MKHYHGTPLTPPANHDAERTALTRMAVARQRMPSRRATRPRESRYTTLGLAVQAALAGALLGGLWWLCYAIGVG